MKPDFATTEFLIQLHKWKELSKNDILPFSSITEENRNMHIFYDDTTPSFIGEDTTQYNIVRNFVFVTDALTGEVKKEILSTFDGVFQDVEATALIFSDQDMPNPSKAHLTISHLLSDFHVLVEGGYITSLAI